MGRPARVLPGFGISTGFTVAYLSLVVLVPLAAVVLEASSMSPGAFWAAVSSRRALASYLLSCGASFVAAAANVVFGVLAAWVLVRYRFPGRSLLDALIDIPFALPTAVSGIALTTLFAPSGWIGAPLAKLGVKAAFTPLGVVLALVFIGLPFVVRAVEPVLEEMDRETEEAAVVLGASRGQTFARIILPHLTPAILTGFALAFARGLGEYGSVVFIAGNMPMHTEVTSLLIMTKLDEFDYAGATAIATVMLGLSFTLLLAINRLQAWSRSRHAGG